LIVLDGSAAVDLLGGGDNLGWVEAQLDGAGRLCAPELLDVEVLAGLRKLAARRVIGPERAAIGVAGLQRIRIRRYRHAPFLPRIWELRDNVTPYDAVYVALAEVLEAPLLTTDLRLARTPGLPVDVIAP
jgi:predicted nucleic acid-binding protein